MPPNNANSGKPEEVVRIKLIREEDYSDEKICGSSEEALEKCSKVGENGIAHSKSQTNVGQGWEPPNMPKRNQSVNSLVDELLCDIYSKLEVKRRISATTCDLSWQDSDHSRSSSREVRSYLQWTSKDANFLKKEKARLEKLIVEEGNKLVKHLKRKNVLIMKREAHYDVITAYIQSVSSKTREATKMKFSLSPGSETGFSQWLDAMKMVAQLPGGMPSEFRTKLWLQLSEKHLNDKNVDWEKVEAAIFNEWTNPDDEELGVQIVKDLHRTGCSLFCGEQEQNQALLKRVLLAYARWNKNVGYCQGFNMLAALILQVMEKDEKNAVKVMIYLIEGVLPESYFANNLRGLSVDMAVLRDLLRLRLPKLSKHLDALQHDTNSGTSYEPPLTNVFTMQWFLTLFSNCLPQQTVLRVWDLVFLYGNEVLLRTALAIWGILQDRVITVESADEFYSIMGVVTREMLEFGLMDANTLVKMIAMVDPFPNELQELREKYLYNISPWTQSVQSAAKKGIRLFYSDPDDQDDTEDEDKIALATAYGVFRRRESTSRELQVSGPTLDISVLKQQYAKLRQRQRQAHVIITAACNSSLPGGLTSGPSVSVNHLLMGKSALVNKGRRIGPPEGSIPPPANKKGEVKDIKKPAITVSGETFRWENSGRGKKESQSEHKNKSNKVGKVCYENKKNRSKNENEEDEEVTNHDRMEVKIFRESGTNDEDDESGSSNSSTSTELCDDEFHQFSDFESEEATNSDASIYHHRENSTKVNRYSSDSTEHPFSRSSGIEFTGNESCDKDKLREIKSLASSFVNEIEEEIAISEKFNRLSESTWCGKSGEEASMENFSSEGTSRKFEDSNNVISLSNEDKFLYDNTQKPEPEVPIYNNLLQTCNIEQNEQNWKTKSDNSTKEENCQKEKIRRKSDLGLSIIKENLEMLHKLHKYSQKTSDSLGTKSLNLSMRNETTDEHYAREWESFDEESSGRCVSEEGDGSILPIEEVQEKPATVERQTTKLLNKGENFLVEKAISPVMLEKPSRAVKVNKEVNTEITFGGEEVEISTTKAKLRMQDDTFREEDEPSAVETFRITREPSLKERDKRDEIKQRIEVSKSDWELKMRKIAELETTTRETLNEIQAQSIHRKTFHQSLDRNTKRTYLDESFAISKETIRSPDSSLAPKMEISYLDSLSEEKSNEREAKISGHSFDAITSRTEKLLAKVEFDHSDEEILCKRDLSPKFDYRNSRGKQFKSLAQESDNDFDAKSSKIFEFHSSPTSPAHRTKAYVKYAEYSSPKRQSSDDRSEDKISLGVLQEEQKSSEDYLNKKYSTEFKAEDKAQEGEGKLKPNPNRSNFNPFPTRTLSRPKDLGVKLGLYPSSSESPFQKS